MSISSFHGILPEIPGIAVDNFETTDKRAYFLSHCHRDHTQGLTNLNLKRHLDKNNVFIYTSEVSAAIIASTSDFSIVKDNVKVLGVGKKMIKLNETDEHEELYVEVTTIPAGHCFGSVMFLFKTTTKTVLFTGDFRVSINDVAKLGQLHCEDNPIHIDKMYVDTTFLTADYENFPKRADCVASAIDEIKKWLDRGEDYFVAIHPSARFGYEYVFNEVYEKLGFKTYIGEDWNLYRTFQHLVPGVTNDAKTRIHKCRNKNERLLHKCLPYDTENKHFLFVHLSAMLWDNFNMEQTAMEKVSENRINVCFSTHCSRSELINFVSYFSPLKVCGFPNEYRVKRVENNFNVVFKAPKRRICNNKKNSKFKKLS